jgi:hypothetical protein
MKFLAPLLLLALSLPAATISSSDTTALLHPGDGLAFDILTGNFGFNAARFGLPALPTEISFTFVSASVGGKVPFTAWLESPDGSVQVPFAGPLFFTPGLLSSSQYSGTVSTLSGYLHLTTAQSAAIFHTGSATILLVDGGSDITLGLLPNTLRQDLWVGLAGGPLSVGALSGAVNFETAVPEPTMLLPLLLVFALFRARRILNSEF